MDNLFLGYASRQETIESFIRCLLASEDPNDIKIQEICARHAGLNLNSLTSDECNYIVQEVERLWPKSM